MDLPTPLQRAGFDGVETFLKREDLHELGAFKWRGALPAVIACRDRGATGVVTASTGNHGAATAWACRQVNLRAIVFAPRDASQAKLAKIRDLGAELRQAGADFDEAKDAAREEATRLGLPFFEDGDEPAQYAGYGAIADEILDQLRRPPGAVVVPVGNGALIGGIGRVLNERSPGTRVVGAVASEAPVMALSFEAGAVVPCDRAATFADGLAARVAIPRAVQTMREVVDRVVRVSEREIARAVGAYAAAGIRAEGAAAAPLAVRAKTPDLPGPIVLIVTGGNIDEPLYRRALTDPDSFPD
jgi:threonine dehydratase